MPGTNTTNEDILAEVARLHERLDRQQRALAASRSWVGLLLHDLEYNPRTQYRIHITASYFWIINLIVVLFIQAIFPDAWAQIAVLYVAVVSLYANFATDYGAASAALSAMGNAPLPVVPMDTTGPALIRTEDPHG